MNNWYEVFTIYTVFCFSIGFLSGYLPMMIKLINERKKSSKKGTSVRGIHWKKRLKRNLLVHWRKKLGFCSQPTLDWEIVLKPLEVLNTENVSLVERFKTSVMPMQVIGFQEDGMKHYLTRKTSTFNVKLVIGEKVETYMNIEESLLKCMERKRF